MKPTADRSRIVIVGASLAGWRTAQALRRHGFQGELCLVGEEPHLPYDRPPLSKQVLLGKRDPASLAHTDEHQLEELGIVLVADSRATAVDVSTRVVRLAGGEERPFDAVVIAVGASPHRPDFGWPPGVQTLRTLEDAVVLRRALTAGPRVAVVGAGFIGLEVASAARAHGLEVTVIEAAAAPLQRAVGPVIGRIAGDLAFENGAQLRLGTGVTRIEGAGRAERVRCSDGSTVGADVVIVGVGVRPNDGWLQGSGVPVDDGVVCDQFGQALADPPVYAVGDVARWMRPELGMHARVEHWTNAVDQAEVVAQNLLGGSSVLTSSPFFWSEQFDTKIQMVGHFPAEAETHIVGGSLAERRFVAVAVTGDQVAGAIGFDQPRLMARFRRLLGAPVSFADARELAQMRSGSPAPAAVAVASKRQSDEGDDPHSC